MSPIAGATREMNNAALYIKFWTSRNRFFHRMMRGSIQSRLSSESHPKFDFLRYEWTYWVSRRELRRGYICSDHCLIQRTKCSDLPAHVCIKRSNHEAHRHRHLLWRHLESTWLVH